MIFDAPRWNFPTDWWCRSKQLPKSVQAPTAKLSCGWLRCPLCWRRPGELSSRDEIIYCKYRYKAQCSCLLSKIGIWIWVPQAFLFSMLYFNALDDLGYRVPRFWDRPISRAARVGLPQVSKDPGWSDLTAAEKFWCCERCWHGVRMCWVRRKSTKKMGIEGITKSVLFKDKAPQIPNLLIISPFKALFHENPGILHF